jgi:hypothetical protein
MNPENLEHSQESQESRNGSFYEPRTIPKKWDVSAFVSRTTSALKGTDEQPTEPIEKLESGSTEDVGANWNPDPFPQPRTIPGKWDVSDMK